MAGNPYNQLFYSSQPNYRIVLKLLKISTQHIEKKKKIIKKNLLK